MPRSSSHRRSPVWSVPAPLSGSGACGACQGERPSAALPQRSPQALPSQRSGLEDVTMCRRTNPIPSPTSHADTQVASLLLQQNVLLTDLLSAVNGLLAVQLGLSSQGRAAQDSHT